MDILEALTPTGREHMNQQPWKADTLPARLCRLADKNGMWAKDAARFQDILEQDNIDPKEINNETIEEAEALGRQWSASIKSRIQSYNNRIKPKHKIEAGVLEAPVVKKGKPRPFGHPITSILRWMGEMNLTEWHAMKLCEHFGIELASSTIKSQLRAGRIGTRGEPAELTKKQQQEIYKIIKD